MARLYAGGADAVVVLEYCYVQTALVGRGARDHRFDEDVDSLGAQR